jgi:hypothetical protein
MILLLFLAIGLVSIRSINISPQITVSSISLAIIGSCVLIFGLLLSSSMSRLFINFSKSSSIFFDY